MMKHLIFFTILLLSLFACKETKTDQSATNITPPPDLTPGESGISEAVLVVDTITGQAITVERPVNALSSAIGDRPVSIKDETAPVVIVPNPKTPQEQRIVKVMTANYWVVWALHRINRPENTQNQGAWFKFLPDGTYKYGFFQKEVGKGAWSFDGKKATLFLDSELKGDDREWSFKISRDEDIMIWVGTDRFHTTDINLKLQNFLVTPKTRTDIGLEELKE